MPLYDFLCSDCGRETEILLTSSGQMPECTHCGSVKVKRLLSAPSSLSGVSRKPGLPGPGDTACCGSAPGMSPGCSGTGSCCGNR